MSMVLYIDGSHRGVPRGSFTEQPRSSDVLGWGIVALADNQAVELSGAIPVPQKACGHHEMLALVEAVRFIKKADVSFDQVSIITDDEVVGYAAQVLHPGNFRQTGELLLKKMLSQVCDLVGDAELERLALECLTTSRLVKVRAHRKAVYNNRADYLASQATLALTGVPAPVEDFDTWLSRGFTAHADGNAYRWYPPFLPKTLPRAA